MDLMESVGKLLAHADEKGSVSEGIKLVFERLKDDSGKHAYTLKARAEGNEPTFTGCGCTDAWRCTGALTLDILNRLGNTDDPFYTDMPMLERVQVQQLAHSAVKIVEL